MSKTILMKLGGEVEGSDTTGGWTTPIAEIKNFAPVTVSPNLGSKQLKFLKRRGFLGFDTAATGYTFSHGMQWVGNPSSGTAPDTSRGAVVYTAEKSATDLKLYQYGSAITTLGTFGTANYRCIGIQETLISGVANLTLNVKLTSSPYTQKALFFPLGGALTEITDGDFPTVSIGCFVHLDGYAFIAGTDGYLYNSDINSISSWTANARIAVQMVPDSLVGLIKIKSYIGALGTRSIEIYKNKGLQSGSPLEVLPDAGLKMGVLHQGAVQELGEGIIFVSVSNEGSGVYIWSGGGEPKKVSNAIVDQNLLVYVNQPGNTPLQGPLPLATSSRIFFAGTTVMFGLKVVVLYINNVGYGYIPSLDLWVTVAVGGTNERGKFFSVGAAQMMIDLVNTGSQNQLLLANQTASTSGVDTDRGVNTEFAASITTSPLSFGTAKFKIFESLRIVGDYTQGTPVTPIVVSYSDDGGLIYTTWGTINMDINPPVSLTRGGSSRKRIFRFSNTSAGQCDISAVELTYSVCTS